MKNIILLFFIILFLFSITASAFLDPVYTRRADISSVDRLVYPRPRVHVLRSDTGNNLYIRSLQIKPIPLGGRVNVSVSVYYDAWFWYANAKVVVKLYDDDGNLLARERISLRRIWAGSHKTGYVIISGVYIGDVKRVVALIR